MGITRSLNRLAKELAVPEAPAIGSVYKDRDTRMGDRYLMVTQVGLIREWAGTKTEQAELVICYQIEPGAFTKGVHKTKVSYANLQKRFIRVAAK